MLKTTDPKKEVTIRKYVTLTLLQVFHNLIPGYRMRDTKPDQKGELEFTSILR